MKIIRFKGVFSLEERIIDLFLEAINRGEKNKKAIEDRIVYILSKTRLDESHFRKAIQIIWNDIFEGKTVAKAVNDFFMKYHIPLETAIKRNEAYMKSSMMKVIFFDYGGVLADEGFKNGLHAIAGLNRLDPETFLEKARELIHTTEYLIGKRDEMFFWDEIRDQTGIKMNDAELRNMILDRFILRKWMMDIIDELGKNHIRLAILSDQTNWLDELDQRDHFFHKFEKVFNSYHIRKSKMDVSLFSDVLGVMKVDPEYALFIDDTAEHVGRAASLGINTILYKDQADFIDRINAYCPGINV
jgi:HAD superfamily hydrolase (TIGR01509 family)